MTSNSSYGYSAPIERILRFEKSSLGVFLLVKFADGQRSWLPLHVIVELAPELTNIYLNRFPDLYRYHRLHWKKKN